MTTSTPIFPSDLPPGCCAIDYIISPLAVWHAAFSPHSTHFIHRRHSPSIPVLASWYSLLQTESSCNDLTQVQYFTKWKLQLNTNRTETILFSKCCPSVLGLLQIHDTFVPWASAVLYLGCLLDSKLLYIEHLHSIANRATAVLCNIFTLLAQDSALTKLMKLTLYKLLIWSILTYTPPLSTVSHVPPSTLNSKVSKTTVYESLVIILLVLHS